MKQEFEFILTPLNEGQELNYIEDFAGDLESLAVRCKEIITGLKKTLPKGTFSMKIEDNACINTWYFSDPCKWYNEDGEEIKAPQLLLTH